MPRCHLEKMPNCVLPLHSHIFSSLYIRSGAEWEDIQISLCSLFIWAVTWLAWVNSSRLNLGRARDWLYKDGQ